MLTETSRGLGLVIENRGTTWVAHRAFFLGAINQKIEEESKEEEEEEEEEEDDDAEERRRRRRR
jgi:hypothetical protein